MIGTQTRAASALLAAALGAASTASAALQTSSWITYVDQNEAAVDQYGRGFDDISVFAYSFDVNDNLIPARPWVDSTLEALRANPVPGRSVLLTIVNDIETNPPVNHSGALIDRVLRDPAKRAEHIRQLVALSARADGIDIDYESLLGQTRDLFTQFIRELRAALPAGKKLSVVAQPKTDNLVGDRGRAMDWAALAPHIDILRVMVYYYSWGGSPPGPVITLSQLREVTRFALSQVPHSKLNITLSLFGWDWPSGGQGQLISYQQALQRAQQFGATPFRDPSNQDLRVNYTDASGRAHQIWIDDDISLRAKINAIRAEGTERVDFWTLGSGDPAFWNFVRAETGGDSGPPPPGVQTVVSLTFDDTFKDHTLAGQLLDQRGMKGTFFINSPRIGSDALYMNRADVDLLKSNGHEIGGHTLNHANLPTLSAAEAQRQVCEDRQALAAAGYQPVSFAYPFGANNASIQSMVRDCGYLGARTVGGLAGPTCSPCPKAEILPPVNPMAALTHDSIRSNMTLADIQKLVTDAEQAGGGWVPLVFHRVCDGCDTSPATLAALLDWLRPRASQGTVVKTYGQAQNEAPPPPAPGVPSITALSPNSRPAGGAAFNLAVDGTGFQSGAVVRWNGANRTTTFLSGSALTASIPAGDVASAGSALVSVFNPAPGGGASNALAFTINTAAAPSQSNPVPSPALLEPSSRRAGGGAFALSVNGSNFISGAIVRWNGTDRPTAFVNSSTLIASIAAADVASAGSASVTVLNPGPGGGTSDALTFTVSGSTEEDSGNPVPAMASFSFRQLYAFPNPSRRGQPVTIRLQTGLADSVEVRVYDISGGPVHGGSALTPQIIDDGNGAGQQHTYDYVWNAAEAGSGIYVYVVTAKKSGTADIRKTGKIGVLK